MRCRTWRGRSTLGSVTVARQESTARRGPGRPRDEELAQRVRTAAREEVAELGTYEVTLASIARRAGVAKSTVYLRWPSVMDLLAEALVEVSQFKLLPSKGDLRADLLQLGEQVVRVSMVTPLLELHMHFVAMGAAAPGVYRRFQSYDMALGIARGKEIFLLARERGEIGRNINLDTAASAFMGALLMNALLGTKTSTPDQKMIKNVVDLFVAGLVHA